ncbi:hypothetical protein L4C34_10285 [Vibrio profundum]|uniref:hypothetical protein n=1 Tax=Vibrio profundum TaxID=2910247 RepID=UPI003D0A197C
MHPNKHGISHTSASTGILYQVAEGSWNLQTAQEFGNEAKSLVLNELPDQWVLLNDLRKWNFCPPEVWDYFPPLYAWLADHGMIAYGVVCTTKMLKHFVTNMDEKAGTPVLFGQFYSDNYDETLEWCQSKLEEAKNQ